MAKKAVIATVVVIAIIAIVGGFFYYSYTQVRVSLDSVNLHSIDWTPFSWSTLFSLGLNALTGNWLAAAFELIDGVNLNLLFGLSNYGILPVYIPELNYDLYVNDVYVGAGRSNLDMTIYPGETRQIMPLQNFKKSSFSPAISSIVSNGGVMNIHVKGTAYFQFLGLSIPVPFESSQQISIVDEIKTRLNSEIQKHDAEDRRAAEVAAAAQAAANAAANLASDLGNSLYKSAKSLQEQLFGSPYDLELDLPGDPIVDSVFEVPAGKFYWYPIPLQCTARVLGGFIASATLGDNIVFYILDEEGFNLIQNNEPFYPYYNSDKVESGVFDVTLNPGNYYFIMSNSYSLISSKDVQLQASAYCLSSQSQNQAEESYNPSQISGEPQIESLQILGYDARAVTALKADNGINMIDGSAGDGDTNVERDERVAIYVTNNSVQKVVIDELSFGGTIYSYTTIPGNKLSAFYDTANLTPGKYAILINTPNSMLSEGLAVLKTYETVTFVIDLDSDLKVGRGTQFKVTTDNGNVFVGTVSIGQQSG